MKRMLFNATQAEELRVAIVDGQTLLDLDIETLGKEQRKGNIYKGVITRIEPSLEACFVDYGTDRHGFLPFKEVSRAYFQGYEGGKARIQDVLKEGMQVIVQVEKDERGNKGAALTTFISLAGRYLVLMPNNPRGGGVSRRIEGEERQELKEAMAALEVPNGMSLIARTAGIGRSVEELEWDFHYLLKLWQAIEEAAAAHSEPYLLFMESALVIRAIRDYFRNDIGEILIDNPEVYEEVSEFMSYVMPNNVGRLKLYEDHTPLFSRFQIEHQIESAFSRSVSLPSGGAIVIDHTEALVSIDVNSARATRGADIEETAFKTNMEAAEEVARQMRLRDLGGLVVIDFIDMENAKHQRDVENVLRDALKKDRARVQMGKLSRFGLLELSRQRLKPALGESSHVACPRCAGTGVIRSIESTALHVLRLIQDAAMKDNTGEVHAQVPVDVATFLLNEKRAELFGLEERLDVSVYLIPNIHLENPHYEITRVRTDDVAEDAAPSYKRVHVPETDESDKPFGGEKAKAARPEPAVKGVKHSRPAPVSAPEPAGEGWWSRFKAWFKGLFGENTAAAEESKPERKSAERRNNGSRRNAPGRRQNAKREPANAAGDKRGGEGETATARTQDKDNNRRPNKRNERNDARNKQQERDNRPVRDAEVSAVQDSVRPAALTAAQAGEAKSEAKANRRTERPRKEEVPAAPAVPAVQSTANEAADSTTAAPVKADNREGRDNKRERNAKRDNPREQQQRKTDSRNKNGEYRTRNEKKRHIPSAAKIEQYLMIEEAADKVRAAVAHVFGETAAPVRSVAAVPAEPLVITVPEPLDASDAPKIVVLPETEEPTPALVAIERTEEDWVADSSRKVRQAVAAVLGEPEPAVPAPAVAAVSDESEPAAPVPVVADVTAMETGGLILVQTRPEALAAAAAVPQADVPAGKRRTDLPPPADTGETSLVLQQVETRQS